MRPVVSFILQLIPAVIFLIILPIAFFFASIAKGLNRLLKGLDRLLDVIVAKFGPCHKVKHKGKENEKQEQHIIQTLRKS